MDAIFRYTIFGNHAASPRSESTFAMADVAVFFSTAFAIFGAPTWLLLGAVREFRRRADPARFAPNLK
jgi:hypothetical protein